MKRSQGSLEGAWPERGGTHKVGSGRGVAISKDDWKWAESQGVESTGAEPTRDGTMEGHGLGLSQSHLGVLRGIGLGCGGV